MTYWVLHGSTSSVVLEAALAEDANQTPLLRYWGARLPPEVLPDTPWREGRAKPPSTLDHEPAHSLFPGYGLGEGGSAALRAHRQGCDFVFAATACTVTPVLQGYQIDLQDTRSQVAVTITLTLDTFDVLRANTRLRNTAEQPLQVDGLASASLLLPTHMRCVHSFYGQWANEFQWQTDILGHSRWGQSNDRGRTSHQCFPGAVVSAAQTDWHQGECYGAHLAWSGNHTQHIDTLDDGTRAWQLGVQLAPGELCLAAHQTFAAPELWASFSARGRNGLMQNFHAAMRAAVHWPGGAPTPRPVHLNTWEAVYFNHVESDLMDLASQAAALGVERFILDDGWFHGRHNDSSSLGDWWPDAGKYPQGLGPLAKHVSALGMQFGLWVEPEMVNPDSVLYRAHPDWALGMAGRPVQTARNQLVLNTALPEVQDELFGKLDALLTELPLSYLKWDMNRDLTQAQSADGRAVGVAWVRGLYALLARLRAAHPTVEIESCASGGGRMDAGILAYTHRFWTSDNTDALSRVGIQRGALQFFPPELLGAHIGPVPFHTTGRSQSLDFRAGVALPLHFGLELDVRGLCNAERAQVQSWVALHKQLRQQLHHSTVWLGDCGDHIVWQAHGTADDLLVIVTRTAPTDARHSPPLRLPMLHHDRLYRIARLDPVGSTAANAGQDAPLQQALRAGQTHSAHGAWLTSAGLALPRMAAESVHIYQFLSKPPSEPISL